MLLALATGLAGAAAGGGAGWPAGRALRERPGMLALAVFLAAAAGLLGFIAARVSGAGPASYALLGATFGFLGGLKWSSSDAFGVLAEKPGDGR